MDFQQKLKHQTLLNSLLQAQSSGKAGDKNRFYKSCFQHFYQELFFICYVYFKQDTWDATSDTFLKIMTCDIQLLPANSYIHLRNYLCKMAANYCKSEKKRLLRKKSLEISYYQDVNQWEEGLESFYHSDTVESLNNAIFHLPMNYQIVVLYQMRGYQVKEIANMLNTSETAIANRLLRARRKLKVLMCIVS
ncbi:MAG: hypothetical protein DHS20C18_49810 [Saprospiraceae bacterium]|nr:MAG: hypothetical protein DHS20C18_49810 [Saprospiraceae bacterium]